MSVSQWELVEKAITFGDRVLLYGPPGTGKTTAAMKVGSPASVFKTTVHPDSTVAEFEGFYRPEGERFVWQDGRAIRAWRDGARLIVDEIDKAEGDVLTFFYAVLDDPDVARLTIGSGETVRPAAGFKVVATMNGHPEDLPDALLDRFDAVILVSEVNPAVYDAAPNDLVPLMQDENLQQALGVGLSARPWKAFDKYRKRVGTDVALQIVFGKRGVELGKVLSVAQAGYNRHESVEDEGYKAADDVVVPDEPVESVY